MIVSKIDPSFLLYKYIQKFFETNSNLINKQRVTSVLCLIFKITFVNAHNIPTCYLWDEEPHGKWLLLSL